MFGGLFGGYFCLESFFSFFKFFFSVSYEFFFGFL